MMNKQINSQRLNASLKSLILLVDNLSLRIKNSVLSQQINKQKKEEDSNKKSKAPNSTELKNAIQQTSKKLDHLPTQSNTKTWSKEGIELKKS